MDEPTEVAALTEAESARRRFANKLTRVLYIGINIFPILGLLTSLGAMPKSRLSFVAWVVALFGVAWFFLALVWIVIRFFPSIQITLRALLTGVISLQIPVAVLMTSASNTQTLYGMGLLFVWILGLLMYVFGVAKRAQ